MKQHALSERDHSNEDSVPCPDRMTGARAKPTRKIHIPELYRSPTRDRDTQGCMKARA